MQLIGLGDEVAGYLRTNVVQAKLKPGTDTYGRFLRYCHIEVQCSLMVLKQKCPCPEILLHLSVTPLEIDLSKIQSSHHLGWMLHSFHGVFFTLILQLLLQMHLYVKVCIYDVV